MQLTVSEARQRLRPKALLYKWLQFVGQMMMPFAQAFRFLTQGQWFAFDRAIDYASPTGGSKWKS